MLPRNLIASAPNSPQTFNVTIVVRPKATIDAAPTTLNFTATRPLSGPFAAIPAQTLTVENTGPAGSLLDFQVQKLTNLSNSWLSGFSTVTGSLDSGDTQAISVLVAPIEGLATGTYQETLRISGYSTNEFVDVLIQLVIT